MFNSFIHFEVILILSIQFNSSNCGYLVFLTPVTMVIVNTFIIKCVIMTVMDTCFIYKIAKSQRTIEYISVDLELK